MEKDWADTLRGKWVGTWKMSKGMEKLLRRMVLPNADLRCTASQAMADPYWTQTEAPTHGHSEYYILEHGGYERSPAYVIVKREIGQRVAFT